LSLGWRLAYRLVDRPQALEPGSIASIAPADGSRVSGARQLFHRRRPCWPRTMRGWKRRTRLPTL